MTQTILEAENLCLAYRDAERPALDRVDLTLNQGDILGLLGPNGAGKTTFISIAATLIRPSSGQLSICGLDRMKHWRKIRALTGLVPQDLALYPSLTGRENLEYYGTLYGVPHKTLTRRIRRYLDLFGLAPRAGKRVETYSGGMKRRINILAGILHKPRLLFLDEPTVGIDAQSRQMILDNLLELNAQGISMIYTSHYMEEIQTLCRQIAILDTGKIIAQGSPDALTRQHADCNSLSDLFFHLTGRELRE